MDRVPILLFFARPKKRRKRKGRTLFLGPSDYPALLARSGRAKTRPDASGLRQSALLIGPLCDARLRNNGIVCGLKTLILKGVTA